MQVTTSYSFDTGLDAFEAIMIDPAVIEKQVATIKGLQSGKVKDLKDDGPLRTYTLVFTLGFKLPGATDLLVLEQRCVYDRTKRTLDYDVFPNIGGKLFDLHGHVQLRADGPDKTVRDTLIETVIHVPGLRQVLEFLLKKQFADNEQTEMQVLKDEVERRRTR